MVGGEQKGGFSHGRWDRGVEGREGGTMRGGERECGGVGMKKKRRFRHENSSFAHFA